MAAELLAKFDDVTMCVTDFDEAMVATAAGRLAPFGDRVECRQADATALPFGDASFDVVLSWIMLHHTVAWEDALAEAVRVLRPGGRLVAYDLLANEPLKLLHGEGDEEHRFMHIDELHHMLSTLPVQDVTVRRGTGGFVARFNAVRS
jgi:ubiquinone/menaquinone biosynthesis C-methylase UbiE